MKRSFPQRLARELGRIPRNVRRFFSRIGQPPQALKKTTEPVDRYQAWITKTEPSLAQLEAQSRESAAWSERPKISLLIPVFETASQFLDELFRSILAQTYNNWEACVVDANSANEPLLRRWAEIDSRIYLQRLQTNLGIAENTNHALKDATGDFVALVDHDDVLPPFALYQLTATIRSNPDAEIFYSDEDRFTVAGRRSNPFFKPEWSPELLYSCMYLGHLTAYKREFALHLGGFRKEFDLSQDYDFALRAVEQARKIVHLPHVLYHWREHAASGASGGKPEARKTNLAALADAVQRRGLAAEVVETPAANRVRMLLREKPIVSIVIPTDSSERAIKCARDLVAQTDYEPVEFIVVTRSGLINKLRTSFTAGGNVRFVAYNEPFNFSRKCNLGAAESTGERLIFLNDDVEPTERGWVEHVIEPLENPEVGAVAPKLLYGDGRVQHAGLVTGVRDLIGTAFHHQPGGSRIHANFVQSMRDVSALSGACLAMRRDDFSRLGGFDETNTPISHSDVDLCFRVRAAGLRCVYTPFATLTHTGRASSDLPDMPVKPALDKASVYLLNRWGKYVTHDPFFTENMRDWLFSDSPVPIRMFARNQDPPTPSQLDLLFVTPDLTRSGAPLLLFHLAQWCRLNGFFVTVVAATDGPLRQQFVAAEIPLIVDPLSSGDHPSLGRLIGKFSAVIANTIKSAQVIRLAHAQGVPALWWVHETKLGEQFLGKDLRIKETLPLASLLVAPSECSLAVYRQYAGEKICALRSGIPDFHLEVKSDRQPTDRIQFLMLGTIEKRKGQDVFIEAIRRMDPSVAKKAQFRIVGNGTEAEFVERIRAATGEISNLEVSDPMSHEESLSLLAGADVLVCASRDESMPLTILEAMCFGKTIIATTVGGIPEYLSDGSNALLLPAEDPFALVTAMERVIRDPAEAKNLGINARTLFETHHTIGDFGCRFVALVESVVNQRKGSRESPGPGDAVVPPQDVITESRASSAISPT
jgi:Glycosyltransferase